MKNDNGLMEKCLALAVPQWIEKLKYKSFKDFEKRRSEIVLRDKNGSEYTIATAISGKGDILMYGGGKPRDAGMLFNFLAEGLAWLALIAKGGVHFGDQHWDAEFEKMPDVQRDSD